MLGFRFCFCLSYGLFKGSCFDWFLDILFVWLDLLFLGFEDDVYLCWVWMFAFGG